MGAVVRAGIQYSAALALVIMGVVGAVATAVAFLPCSGPNNDVPQTSQCLEAKDSPGHLDLLNSMWIAALIIAAVSIILARGKAARWLAVAAGLLVLVLNYVTEYGVWLATDPSTADVAVGTGYSMAGAWLCAGLLTAVSATISSVRRVRVDAASDTPPDAARVYVPQQSPFG